MYIPKICNSHRIKTSFDISRSLFKITATKQALLKRTLSNIIYPNTKKLIMISLDWTRPKDPPLSLGHASILANLQANRINVIAKSWAVNHSNFQVDDVLNFLETYTVMSNTNTNITNTIATDIALGVFVWNEIEVQKIIKYLKLKKFPGNIILGGPQISYVKSNIEKYYPDGDIFIKGYAEDALVQYMLSKEKYPTIQGIHYANKYQIVNNKVTNLLSATADLNNLPSPYLTGIIKKQSFIRWETQRGCPFKCSFCQHRESDSDSSGSNKRRFFPNLRIQQEIEWLVNDHIVQDIAILDPTFNSGVDNHYLDVLKQFAIRKYKGKLALQCRLEMVTNEFLDLVEEVNQNGRVVLEFGLQTIHKQEQYYIQRPNNMNKIKTILHEIEKRKIESEISLIFGLPGQTINSFQESIDFCKSFNIPTLHAFPLMLLRGTPLYDQKQSLRLIESSEENFEKISRITNNIPHVISSPSFTYDDWLKMAEISENLELFNTK